MISNNDDSGTTTPPDPNENPTPKPKSKEGRSGRHKDTCASNQGAACDCRAVPPGAAAGGSQAKETLAAIEAGKTKNLEKKLAETEDKLNREKQLRAKSEKVIDATRKISTPGSPKKSLWETIKAALRDPLDL